MRHEKCEFIACRASTFRLECVVGCAHAQVPPRNILLIIADDYGIDATQYYPKTDRRVTTPPAPATPNLVAAGGERAPVPQCLGAAELLADAGHDHDRALRLPHRHRQAGARGSEPPPPVLSVELSSRCPRRSQARRGQPKLSTSPRRQVAPEPRHQRSATCMAGSTSPGPHPSLAHLPDYFAGPRS